MKPRGPLMIEHRLIEKVLRVARKKAEAMSAENYDPVLIDAIVDFIKVYADRTHHGKEEDILFAQLEKKKMNAGDTLLMKELVDEHKQARQKVGEIVRLNEQFKNGKPEVVPVISEIILWLSNFYPRHIKKEDAIFFPDTDKYFSEQELETMLTDFQEFDRKMIHEKYQNLYEQLKN